MTKKAKALLVVPPLHHFSSSHRKPLSASWLQVMVPSCFAADFVATGTRSPILLLCEPTSCCFCVVVLPSSKQCWHITVNSQVSLAAMEGGEFGRFLTNH